MSEIVEALSNLGDPIYWVAVTVAVLVAAATGIIPGFSGVLVMALSIPFIVEWFRDDPAIGLVALAAMTGVNNTLDSIPAILLGQPGSATQVTFLEGHQLARQGKAAHTLGAVYGVSMLGGIVGAATLAVLIPIIKPFILNFGFAEIAAFAFFGIAMVSALSAGAMVKGLLAGSLGVLFGTVGINPITGDVRYVFQQPSLWGGLPLISTTIGLFALPEMIDLSMARRPVAPANAVMSTREVFRGTLDGLKRWRIMIRQSLFGVLMGSIPGVGAAVIDWLSYAFGIFFTKDKSQFGKGSLDGVLFAESAQNSKEAGQAVPSLALGVPGGLAWAIVIVAMTAMDVQPGPQMLGRFADVTILLVITLAIGNIMVTALGIVATGQLAKLTRIPYPIIGGVIIPIAFLTGVVNMTNWLAIPIILVFGGIGIIMKLFQWPRPPLLLGVILGPIIELNFQSAVNVHGMIGVLTRPIAIVLIVVAVATAYFFYRSGKSNIREREAQRSTPSGGADTGPASQPTLVQAFLQARNIPVLLALGAGMAFVAATLMEPGFTPTASFMPRLMGSLVIGFALLQLFLNLKDRAHAKVDIMDLGMMSLTAPGVKYAGMMLAIGFLGFILVSGILGLRWGAMALGAWIPLSLLSNRWRYFGALIAMAVVLLFAFVMADNLLFIIWPEPALFEWIGREILGSGE